MNYDVIVVGGGHAGCEASSASAKMGKKTLLITINIKNIADMPCNPSIGGSATGIVVREIDALGGFMGKAADHEYLQMKMLNTKKGPGVQCLRAAILSAQLNVIINVNSMKDREYAENIEKECNQLVEDGVRICDEVYKKVLVALG